MKKYLLAALLALSVSIASAAPGLPGVPASLVTLHDYEVDHWHGGYEINIHIQGTGVWQIWCVDSDGNPTLLFQARHTTPHLAPWATWVASTDDLTFYLVSYDMAGWAHLTHLK